MTSLADQTSSQLGGPRSVLTLQKRDHVELDRLLHAIDAAGGAERQELLTRLCRLVFPHAFAEESVLWPVVRRVLTAGQLIALGAAWEAVRRTAPTRPHPVVARRPPGNVVAAAPLTVVDRLRDRLDRIARRSGGAPGAVASRLSAGLAGAAGLIEHVPPLTRGEHPSTRATR
jgi:hypothetical protein